MSRTTEISKTVFVGNSDLSGDIELISETGAIAIPGKVLREFVFKFSKEEIKKVVDHFANKEVCICDIEEYLNAILR